MILDPTGRVLLFRYHDEHIGAFWATPGGELRPGETHAEAASRELFEETGQALPVGAVVMEREAVFAVARAGPARWLERYLVVLAPDAFFPSAAGWTEEEQATIRADRWWTPDEMGASAEIFLPDTLAALVRTLAVS